MKNWVVLLTICSSMAWSQTPQTVQHIDSLVLEINAKKLTQIIVIHDTLTQLSGQKEKEIMAYLEKGITKKVVVSFCDFSNRVREVYFGPGKDFINKVIYIKEYDPISLALFAEVYVWQRKLVKSIVTEPLNQDEKKYPARMIERSNYEIIVKVHLK